MIATELIINGVIYYYQQRHLKEDALWECAFADKKGECAEIELGDLIAYDESLGQANKELEKKINDSGLKFGIDNELVLFKFIDVEKQRKIILLAKKIKEELKGEWMSEETRYAQWRHIMKERTGFIFSREKYITI